MWKPVSLTTETTVKPVLSGNSKLGKTKVLKTDGSLMQVKSIAECSLAECSLNAGQKYCRMLQESILQYFWPALSDNGSWKPIFGLLLNGC